MKRIASITTALMSFVLAFALCSCGSANVANPVHETDAQGLVDETGIALDAPKGAEDVVYAYIDAASDEESAIAQVTFKLDGKAYTYRAAMTDEVDLMDGLNGSDMNKVKERMNAATEKGAALAGLNYDSWKNSASVEVSYCKGVYAHSKEAPSFIAWLDVAPGVLYSLSADDEVDQMVLYKIANSTFVPMQGEV